jgi:hypothetical protein
VEGREGSSLGSRCATKVRQGAYYEPVASARGESSYAKDEALARTLWEWSEREMHEKGYLAADDVV